MQTAMSEAGCGRNTAHRASPVKRVKTAASRGETMQWFAGVRGMVRGGLACIVAVLCNNHDKPNRRLSHGEQCRAAAGCGSGAVNGGMERPRQCWGSVMTE